MQVHNKEPRALAASSSSAAKIPSRRRPWDPNGGWLTLTLCLTTCDPAHLPLVKPSERWASVSCLEVTALAACFDECSGFLAHLATNSGALWIRTGRNVQKEDLEHSGCKKKRFWTPYAVLIHWIKNCSEVSRCNFLFSFFLTIRVTLFLMKPHLRKRVRGHKKRSKFCEVEILRLKWKFLFCD